MDAEQLLNALLDKVVKDMGINPNDVPTGPTTVSGNGASAEFTAS